MLNDFKISIRLKKLLQLILRNSQQLRINLERKVLKSNPIMNLK